MSDYYKRVCNNLRAEGLCQIHIPTPNEKDARIAALEEKLSDKVSFEYGFRCGALEQWVAEMKAELAALKARRCEGCRHADKNGDPWGCRANMLLFPKPAECCNRWTARAENGSEVTP